MLDAFASHTLPSFARRAIGLVGKLVASSSCPIADKLLALLRRDCCQGAVAGALGICFADALVTLARATTDGACCSLVLVALVCAQPSEKVALVHLALVWMRLAGGGALHRGFAISIPVARPSIACSAFAGVLHDGAVPSSLIALVVLALVWVRRALGRAGFGGDTNT